MSKHPVRLNCYYYNDSGDRKIVTADYLFIELKNKQILTLDISGLRAGISIMDETINGTPPHRVPALSITPGAVNVIEIQSQLIEISSPACNFFGFDDKNVNSSGG